MARVTPAYLMTLKAVPASLYPNYNSRMMARLPMMLKTRKGSHLSWNLRGIILIRIDQTCEYMATPTMIAALMKERRMYPL